MKVIVPGKASSTRVPDKNYREFYEKNQVWSKSLMDILLEKLTKVIHPDHIYVSCEEADRRGCIEKHRCHFLHRNTAFSDNNMPYGKVMRYMIDQLPEDDNDDGDILYAACINPLFDEFEQIFEIWNNHRDELDSLAVVHPHQEYLLDGNMNPIGWNFGKWHPSSQKLPPMYSTSFEASIFKRDTFDRCEYFWGTDPYWYISDKPSIDIDTMEDFEMAQVMYAKFNE